ncbi:DUF3024 domain-containing protein [Martelella alba]|nr:DUF3024 domain-containing protein [Martelella alba]
MALSESEYQSVRVELTRFLQSRLGRSDKGGDGELLYQITGQSVCLFALRQNAQGEPGEKAPLAVAKINFLRPSGVWKLFWMNDALRWHAYEGGTVKSLGKALEIIEADERGRFWRKRPPSHRQAH